MKHSNLLSLKSCIPCREGTAPLSLASQKLLLEKLSKEWKIVDGLKLRREFRFPNFALAFDFTKKISEIAEREGHHPSILLEWGRVAVEIYTHKIKGLTESDFILAAKCDAVFS